jgi:Fic family protein
LRDAIQGWADFINDSQRGVDALLKVACAAFGFVCLHPFMGGTRVMGSG